MSKVTTPKPRNVFTLKDLENIRVRLPPNFSQTGKTLIARVGVDGGVTLEMHDTIRQGQSAADISKLERAPRVVSGLDAQTIKSSRIEATREVIANASDQEGTPSPSLHSETIRMQPPLKHLKENMAQLDSVAFKGNKTGSFLLDQIDRSLTAHWEYLDALASGREKPDFMELLHKNGVIYHIYTKLCGQKLQIRPEIPLTRVLFPLKGQNWLSLTGRELERKIPENFLQMLDDHQLQALSVLKKRAVLIADEIRTNAKLYEDFCKMKFPIVGPYDIRDSIDVLGAVPTTPKGNVKFQELHDLARCLIEIWHVFPTLDSSVLKFYQILNKEFVWSRYDGTSPRKAFSEFLQERKLEIPRTDELVRKLVEVWTGPNETRDFLLKNLLSSKKDDKSGESDITRYRAGLRMPLDRPMEDNPLKKPRPISTEARKRADQFLSDVSVKLENYGPATITLTRNAEEFLRALSKSKETALLVPNVKAYLLSFADPAFVNLAVMRMHATLQEKSVYLEEHETFAEAEAELDDPDGVGQFGGYDD